MPIDDIICGNGDQGRDAGLGPSLGRILGITRDPEHPVASVDHLRGLKGPEVVYHTIIKEQSAASTRMIDAVQQRLKDAGIIGYPSYGEIFNGDTSYVCYPRFNLISIGSQAVLLEYFSAALHRLVEMQAVMTGFLSAGMIDIPERRSVDFLNRFFEEALILPGRDAGREEYLAAGHRLADTLRDYAKALDREIRMRPTFTHGDAKAENLLYHDGTAIIRDPEYPQAKRVEMYDPRYTISVPEEDLECFLHTIMADPHYSPMIADNGAFRQYAQQQFVSEYRAYEPGFLISPARQEAVSILIAIEEFRHHLKHYAGDPVHARSAEFYLSLLSEKLGSQFTDFMQLTGYGDIRRQQALVPQPDGPVIPSDTSAKSLYA